MESFLQIENGAETEKIPLHRLHRIYIFVLYIFICSLLNLIRLFRSLKNILTIFFNYKRRKQNCSLIVSNLN